MAYVVAEPCADVLDQACVEECPVDCIYQGERMMYIHPEECVDCAACEVVCPVEAIYFEDDVPDRWSAYTGANAEFFTEIGSPGGAITVGRLGHDVEPVISLPRDAGRQAAVDKPPAR
ncbi:ferredoxin [Streptomyces sp. NPDC101150]|uniref:ferredoxin n=1 Tax=Streptomyces sp. NPDC101150 TaxID=3366114 RepID=UPI0037F56726